MNPDSSAKGHALLQLVCYPRVPTRVCTRGVPGYLVEYVLWGYPGTYPSMYSRGTWVPTYPIMYSGGTRVPTYPSMYSGGTGVPTRVCVLGVPGCLPENVLSGYPGTYPSMAKQAGLATGYLRVHALQNPPCKLQL